MLLLYFQIRDLADEEILKDVEVLFAWVSFSLLVPTCRSLPIPKLYTDWTLIVQILFYSVTGQQVSSCPGKPRAAKDAVLRLH